MLLRKFRPLFKTISLQTLFDHGGRVVPKKAVNKPTYPATLLLPASEPKIREVADNWTTLVMDQENWSDRAAALLGVMEAALTEARSWTQTAFMGDFVHSFALSILVTSRRMAPGERAPAPKRRPAPGAYGPEYDGPRRAEGGAGPAPLPNRDETRATSPGELHPDE